MICWGDHTAPHRKSLRPIPFVVHPRGAKAYGLCGCWRSDRL